MPLTFCGIDPGTTGALAFLDAADLSRVVVYDMPEANKQVEPCRLAEIIRKHGPALAVVEQQGPKPTDGCRQAFSIGGSFMAARAVLAVLGVPTHLATPAKWMQHAGIYGAADPKEAGRALALRLWPADAATFRRKSDHNRADAALIARFAAETLKG
ncbi:hypothetical protein MKK69_04560 [Methylobacterium sp. J-026]|uniref:hypothetical protein n=1 Tax=Methylobacterium sp. J-026 TaxID=2836624 RepID=UPI001FBB040F|nr:hypothetical protein [Methylobacterium sp. J-026]MCJ2133340.1 hypothetical protein [Methylobacterium sp. J-026]